MKKLSDYGQDGFLAIVKVNYYWRYLDDLLLWNSLLSIFDPCLFKIGCFGDQMSCSQVIQNRRQHSQNFNDDLQLHF